MVAKGWRNLVIGKLLLVAAAMVAFVLLLTLAPDAMASIVAWVSENIKWIAVGLALVIIYLIFNATKTS